MKHGPLRLYYKTYATPADSPDISDVSSFTELGMIVPGSIEIVHDEEKFVGDGEAFLAAIDRKVIGQSLHISGVLRPDDQTAIAITSGLKAADVSDESGEDPKYYQLEHGGYRDTNWMNIIIKQQIGASLYRYYYVIKGEFNRAGSEKYSKLEPNDIPFEIHAVCLESGTHAGKLAIQRLQYAVTTPAIDTILPASQSIGNMVNISGTGFGSSRGDSVVTFHDAKVAVIYHYWTDNEIGVIIPADAATGNVKVTVNGVDSANESYTIV